MTRLMVRDEAFVEWGYEYAECGVHRGGLPLRVARERMSGKHKLVRESIRFAMCYADCMFVFQANLTLMHRQACNALDALLEILFDVIEHYFLLRMNRLSDLLDTAVHALLEVKSFI